MSKALDIWFGEAWGESIALGLYGFFDDAKILQDWLKELALELR